jgi:hypothetical protein
MTTVAPGCVRRPAAAPIVVSGDLTRAMVRRSAVVRRDPLPGASIELLHSDRPEGRGPFTPIGLTTTTDRAGRWSFSLSDPVPSQDFFAAVAAAAGLASSPTSVCGNQAAP